MNLPRSLFLGGFLIVAVPRLIPAQEPKPVASYPDSEASQHAGEEATITGKVVTVSKSAKGTVYLNFGARFPKHTFSGMVPVKDQEKVGDLTSYEGKLTSITGRIELASQDHKPQILISKPEQIKLAEPVPSSSTSSAPASTAPVDSAPPTPPKATPQPPAPPVRTAKKIVLGARWNSPAQRGDLTRKDLAMLFGALGTESESTEVDPSMMVYPDIPVLSPLAVAKKHLRLENAAASVSRIGCPGLPLDSLTAHVFSGVFPDGYTRLCLVTDNAEQVVSVLLTDENSRLRTTDLTDKFGYHTYNFISGRTKATNELVVKHEVVISGRTTGVVMIDSLLIDPNDPEPTPSFLSGRYSRPKARKPTTGRVLERSRWYVPQPLVNLILRCVGSR